MHYLICSEVIRRHGEVSVHIKGSEYLSKKISLDPLENFLETKGNAEVLI